MLIEELRTKLGTINYANASEYFDAFGQVGDWNEEQVLEWIQIFAEQDTDDYTGLAWDIVQLIEDNVGPDGLEKLKKLSSYWAQIAVHGM
ncbi:hypothetical protein [Deinococcus navajonensis]|uniref:Uncharacterized protein n=1 Tax=Deinococcus navajonensis TaxID=309884 RepID=A0ABV8XJ02_9DEIO